MSDRIIIYFTVALALFFLWTLFFPSKRQNQPIEEKKSITIEIPKSKDVIYYDDDLYRIAISKVGGFISEVYLKKYNTYVSKNYPLLLFKNLKDKQFNAQILNKQVILENGSDTIIYKFNENYTIDIKTTESDIISYGLLGSMDSYEARFSSLIYFDDKWHKISENNLKSPYEVKNIFVNYFGSRNHYFAFVVLDKTDYLRGLLYDSRIILEAHVPKNHFKVYVGPIDPQILSRIDKKLSMLYDWGFVLIAPFSQAIFYIFRILHFLIPNYGVVIIIFALLLKIMFSPLTYISYKSIQKLSKIQPEIQKIQKVFKDDPERMQKEILKIYQEHNVNPFSGCFPLLIQLPIFFALYQVLTSTIDLKNAYFLWWIKDLSSKDPYFVLPIIMTIVSLLNSLIQPTTDKNSKILSLTISFAFLFLFLTFPAGLVLYWLSYSLFSMVEQVIFKSFLLKGG